MCDPRLEELIDDVTKEKSWTGNCLCGSHFHKRGLPHDHFLIVLELNRLLELETAWIRSFRPMTIITPSSCVMVHDHAVLRSPPLPASKRASSARKAFQSPFHPSTLISNSGLPHGERKNDIESYAFILNENSMSSACALQNLIHLRLCLQKKAHRLSSRVIHLDQ